MKPLLGETNATERPVPDPLDYPIERARTRELLDHAGTWISAALIVVFFGLPLFRGLNNTEFGWDEPIYSYAVDKMLENGDWITPRAIPSETTAFLEKPPLKFWIVAGSIRAGLLPHNEGGQRFWDAAFGVVVFLYVFAIGRVAGGWVCGLVAAFVLFVQRPLIFDHGLRSNSMETALILSYCAAIYHAIAWAHGTKPWQRWAHPLLVAVWFLLGFMTKFVAAVFLPAILVSTALLFPAWRRRAAADWRQWAAAALVVAAGSVPWFVYETLEHGRVFWRVILGEHVFLRFTKFLDPAHLQPWHYYFTAIRHELDANRTFVLVAIGTVLLLIKTIRTRWDLGGLLVLWFALPLAAISFGTSKLYHYTYPFLPPLAIAAGLVPAALLGRNAFVKEPFSRLVDRVSSSGVARWLQSSPPAVRWSVGVLAALAFVMAVLTPFVGTLRIDPGGVLLFRNSSTIRPMLAAAVLLMLLGAGRAVSFALLVPLIVLAMPLQPYRAIIEDLPRRRAPVRAMRECLRSIQDGGAPRGIVSHTARPTRWEYWYYFGPLGFEEPGPADDATISSRLFDPPSQRPVLLHESEYAEYFTRLVGGPDSQRALARLTDVRQFTFMDGQRLLLPGPYGVCADRVRADALRR